jgi:hypothetical protein
VPASAAASRATPFWAKAEALGILVFIHPEGPAELEVVDAPRYAPGRAVEELAEEATPGPGRLPRI